MVPFISHIRTRHSLKKESLFYYTNKSAQVRSGHSLTSTLLSYFILEVPWLPIYFSFKFTWQHTHIKSDLFLYLFLHPLCPTVWVITDEKTWGKFKELSQGQNCSCPNSPRLSFLNWALGSSVGLFITQLRRHDAFYNWSPWLSWPMLSKSPIHSVRIPTFPWASSQEFPVHALSITPFALNAYAFLLCSELSPTYPSYRKTNSLASVFAPIVVFLNEVCFPLLEHALQILLLLLLCSYL